MSKNSRLVATIWCPYLARPLICYDFFVIFTRHSHWLQCSHGYTWSVKNLYIIPVWVRTCTTKQHTMPLKTTSALRSSYTCRQARATNETNKQTNRLAKRKKQRKNMPQDPRAHEDMQWTRQTGVNEADGGLVSSFMGHYSRPKHQLDWLLSLAKHKFDGSVSGAKQHQ